MATATISVPKEYGYVLLAAVAMSFEYYMTGGLVAGGARRNILGKDFVARIAKSKEGQTLIEDHKKATGAASTEDAVKSLVGGYPDMGNGRIADLLSYDDWYKFNNAQRAHYNYLEAMPALLAFLFIGGIRAPVVAAAAGGAVVFGRFFYAYGYTSSGPNGRYGFLAVPSSIGLLTLFGTAVYSALKVAQIV